MIPIGMINYNQIAYYTTDNKVGICPIEVWEEKTKNTTIQLFALLYLSPQEIADIYLLHKIDKIEFALTVQDYMGMYPNMVMN